MLGRRTALVIISVLVPILAVGLFVWKERVSEESPTWLFSQSADSAELVPGEAGTYTLTLNNPDIRTVAFTDRPDRMAKFFDAEELVESWKFLFASSPPNAVLVEHGPTGETSSLVLELLDSRLVDGSLEFNVALLADEETTSSLRAMGGNPYQEIPQSMSQVSLFIDDVYSSTWGTETYTCSAQPPEPITRAAVPFFDPVASDFVLQCQSSGGMVNSSYSPPAGS